MSFDFSKKKVNVARIYTDACFIDKIEVISKKIKTTEEIINNFVFIYLFFLFGVFCFYVNFSFLKCKYLKAKWNLFKKKEVVNAPLALVIN